MPWSVIRLRTLWQLLQALKFQIKNGLIFYQCCATMLNTMILMLNSRPSPPWATSAKNFNSSTASTPTIWIKALKTPSSLLLLTTLTKETPKPPLNLAGSLFELWSHLFLTLVQISWSSMRRTSSWKESSWLVKATTKILLKVLWLVWRISPLKNMNTCNNISKTFVTRR